MRFFVAVLLALTIPIQGLAAVATGQCMVLGHHDAGMAAGHGASHADAKGQDHEGHDHAGHDHAGHAQTDEAAPKSVHEDGKKGGCGPCAACCASAFMPGQDRLLLPDFAATPKYAFSQLPPRGVLPHGLDRPPLAL